METLPIMSVSGIRGIVDETLTTNLVSRIAYLQTRAAGGGKIAVGRDTRPSGEAMARAAFRGIRAAGGVPVDLGIAPTPTVCVAVAELQASSGIIITASHNPIEYNGYKMVHASGRLFNGAECEEIYAAYRNCDYPDDAVLGAAGDESGEKFDAAAVHIRRITSQVDVGLIRLKNITVAVDAINGAASAVFPALLDALGVRWVGVHTGLDGVFARNAEPRAEFLIDLAALCKDQPGCWGGFAFDPGADRLATVAETGHAISEEMTLVFALQNILAKRSSPVATNLSTSMLIDDVATRFGVKVVRTKIGEANVVEGMVRHSCAAGGEGNGGLIYPAISWCRDGLAAMAIIIELMARSDTRLSSLSAQWPEYFIVKEKVAIGSIEPAAAIEAVAEKFALDATDRLEGLKILRDNGWVHLRASNTEPIIRCYAEARTAEEAQELADLVIGALREVV